MDAISEIESLIWEIRAKTNLNTMEATRLALWIYRRDHPEFNDEALA